MNFLTKLYTMRILYDDDVFPSGKYEGKTVKEVLKKDPLYVKQFNSRTTRGFHNNLAISDEVLTLARHGQPRND